MSASRSARLWIAATISGGSAARRTSMSSVADCGSGAGRTSGASSTGSIGSAGSNGSAGSIDSAGSGATGHLQVANGGGNQARLGDADEGLLEEQGHGCDLAEAGL